jgi:hypothetical protein
VTGGPGGIFNIPKPALRTHYWTVMLAAALALWLTANLRRSAWGRAFLAVKSSEVAAESLGLSSYYVRIAAFTVSAAFAGAAGALFTFLNGYISPDSFTLQTRSSAFWPSSSADSGASPAPSQAAPLTILPELGQAPGLPAHPLALLLVSIYWLPEGVIGKLSKARRAEAASPHRPASRALGPRPIPRTACCSPRAEEPVLRRSRGSVRWSDRDAKHPRLIGPNGAGKTSP